jgi:hypothetical protein
VSDDRGEARSDPGIEPASTEGDARPVGLPAAKSEARRKPSDEPAPEGTAALRPLRPSRDDSASKAEERPPGLTQMTTSARLRLQLVLDHDDERPRISSIPPPPDPRKPPSLPVEKVTFDPAELKLVRSLGRWIAFSGLMTLTIGALTGLSYFTGEGKVAHVVVGILATALAFWLLAAAITFHRAARKSRSVGQHLVSGFGLLRSALLLKAVLLFAAMVLGCFTFSLAASLLFLL